MTIQLAVLGLNKIGVSIGLALKDNPLKIDRVGTDIDMLHEQKAMKMGAFDRVIHNIAGCVEDASMIVLALPADEVRRTLELIAPALKPGAVVLDTSAMGITPINWAKELFEEERYMVMFKPSLNPTYAVQDDFTLDQAHPDLFKNSLIAIGSDNDTHPDALKLAADFASLLGAKPYFIDPLEAEGLSAGNEILPRIAAAALYKAVADQPGWNEGRKLAGTALLEGTQMLMALDEKKELGLTMLNNRENSVRVINNLITALIEYRTLIDNQDSEALKNSLDNAINGRILWWKQREAADWEPKSDAPPLPSAGQMIGKLFGFSGRPKEPKK